MVRVLFVCLGNICRSPTAHGVFLKQLEVRKLQHEVDVDSAGTAAWHVGKAPDPRTIKAAAKRQYDLASLKARQVTAADFDEYDYVLAMDESNLNDLMALKPHSAKTHPALFLNYANHYGEREVPDPYYGGADGFEHVLDLVEDACKGLLDEIEQRLQKARHI